MIDRPAPATLAVIGAGPAGLMAAEIASAAGVRVVVHDAMPNPGRKFLLAGRGGLNLTHSEPLDRFLTRYGRAAAALEPAIRAFPPAALIEWCEGLGQPTFVGSSGRVFPKSLKASPLLRAWLARLAGAGVRFALRHRWLGWREDGALRFATPGGEMSATAHAVILALGGASWPRLGSTGSWVDILRRRGIVVDELRPSNCGFAIGWSEPFRARHAGAPLKGIALTFGGQTVRGEAVVTEAGLEGGAVYALSGAIRDALAAGEAAEIAIDLRPDIAEEEIVRRLSQPRGSQSASNFLRKRLGLSPVAIALLHEAARPAPREAAALARLVKHLPLRPTAASPIARAISSAGGIPFAELGPDLMLLRMPGVFVAGEMLDWEAPTGGYLLQACFATAAAAARGALKWVGQNGAARVG